MSAKRLGAGRAAGSLAPASFAVRALDRLRGLLGQVPEESAEAAVLVLVPCRDVHTVGMRSPIDVALVDRAGRVVAARRAVGPWRRVRHRSAVAVIERFASDGPWFCEGDAVGVGALDARAAAQRERSVR